MRCWRRRSCSTSGPRAVLAKGGHLPGDTLTDWLVTRGGHQAFTGAAHRHAPHPWHRLHAGVGAGVRAGAGDGAARGGGAGAGLCGAGHRARAGLWRRAWAAGFLSRCHDLVRLRGSCTGRCRRRGRGGRGPWAGPVVAAAVILDRRSVPTGLDDSKKLTEPARERLFAPICADVRGTASAWRASPKSTRSTFIGRRCWRWSARSRRSGCDPDHVLVDGNRLPRWPHAATAIVKGDAQCRCRSRRRRSSPR